MSTLDVLIQKLAGANSSSSSVTEETVEGSIVTATLTDPVFVEKLASAVDFIVDTIDTSQQDAAETSEPKEASVPEEYTQHILEAVKSQKTENISEISGLLRKKLQERALDNEKKAAAGATNEASDVAKVVLGKLTKLQSNKTASVEEAADDVAEEIDESSLDSAFSTEPYVSEETDTSNTEVDGEGEIKAASVDQTLADVLNAALSSNEQSDVSAPNEGAKTAGVRGGNGLTARKQGVEILKGKLLATVGKEAQS